MGKLLDLSEQRFGRWTVLRPAPRRHYKTGRPETYWLCRCDCGVESPVQTNSLRRGESQSCGCLQREVTSATNATHRMRDTATYRSWNAMRNRCKNKRAERYPQYGGRGIAVCERWNQFENFLTDMGKRPIGKTLDRYPDKNGNYEPGNCRWATVTEQNRNRRNVTKGQP